MANRRNRGGVGLKLSSAPLNSGDFDQAPRSAASDLGLLCSSKDARCIWVKLGIVDINLVLIAVQWLVKSVMYCR